MISYMISYMIWKYHIWYHSFLWYHTQYHSFLYLISYMISCMIWKYHLWYHSFFIWYMIWYHIWYLSVCSCRSCPGTACWCKRWWAWAWCWLGPTNGWSVTMLTKTSAWWGPVSKVISKSLTCGRKGMDLKTTPSVLHRRQLLVVCYPTIPHSFKDDWRLGDTSAYTQRDRGNGSRLYEVNIWMWRYGRGRSRMVSIAEAERIRSVSAKAGSGRPQGRGSFAARQLPQRGLPVPKAAVGRIEHRSMISYVIS